MPTKIEVLVVHSEAELVAAVCAALEEAISSYMFDRYGLFDLEDYDF